MSQTADTATASLPRNPAASGDRAERWFEILLWTDHEICSECFSRIKASDVAERDGWGNEETMSWRTPHAIMGEDLVDPPATVANCRPKPEMKTTCVECGSVGGLGQSNALSTEEAVNRVDAIVARLEEAGYFVASDVVYQVVRHLKSQPDHTDNDKRIFATAAALGVKHG